MDLPPGALLPPSALLGHLYDLMLSLLKVLRTLLRVARLYVPPEDISHHTSAVSGS